MVTLGTALRTPFSFLFVRSRAEERVATYVLREHHRGRQLAEILEDPFVRNRLSEAAVSRLLEHPELVHALGDDIAALSPEG